MEFCRSHRCRCDFGLDSRPVLLVPLGHRASATWWTIGHRAHRVGRAVAVVGRRGDARNCSAIVFLFAPPIYDYFEVSPMTYRKHMAQTAKYWSGGISERDFMVNYYWRSIPMNSFECRDRIIEIGGPKASVCLIDDWSPGVFFQTDFQCPSRFFMSYFVDWLNEEYVREPLKHWKQEFRDTMADTPPDFIVADVEAEILGTAPWFGHEWHEMGDCAGGKLFQRMTVEGEQE